MIIAFMMLLFMFILMSMFSNTDWNEELRNYPYKIAFNGMIIATFCAYVLNFGVIASILTGSVLAFYYDYRKNKNSNK